MDVRPALRVASDFLPSPIGTGEKRGSPKRDSASDPRRIFEKGCQLRKESRPMDILGRQTVYYRLLRNMVWSLPADSSRIELAQKYAGQIDIYKIDVDKEKELAAAFGIRSIPTLLFCPKDGQPQLAQGALSKADFERAIQEVLLKK